MLGPGMISSVMMLDEWSYVADVVVQQMRRRLKPTLKKIMRTRRSERSNIHSTAGIQRYQSYSWLKTLVWLKGQEKLGTILEHCAGGDLHEETNYYHERRHNMAVNEKLVVPFSKPHWSGNYEEQRHNKSCLEIGVSSNSYQYR